MTEKINQTFEDDATQKMAYCGLLRFSGMKYIEICELTKFPMPTVKTRLHRHWKKYINDKNYRKKIDGLVEK